MNQFNIIWQSTYNKDDVLDDVGGGVLDDFLFMCFINNRFFVKFMSFGIVDVFLMIFVHDEIYGF
jgi:hypothetical protein